MNDECLDWRWQLQNSLKGYDGLKQLSDRGVVIDPDWRNVISKYPFLVTPYYASLIDPGDADDPIGIQCLPAGSELANDEYKPDPFSEKEHMPVEGLIHRFPDRVLVLATARCAVNCRHCTRKNWITSCQAADVPDMGSISEYISSNPDIREVLVSGGDPLLLETDQLEYILKTLSCIANVKVMRIGTRVPVVLPFRVDEELCTMLKKYRPLWINTQFNHPKELTEEAVGACRRLIDSGIPVSNQSVLMKGVNDSEELCEELFTTLQENMIRPYYMFLCDPVKGTAGLRTDIETGRRIEESLRGRVGGMALPKFVADIPGECGKVQLGDV